MSEPQPTRLLFLAHRAPYPPDRGDRIRSFHALRHFAKSCQVYLGAVNDESLSPDALAILQTLTADLAIVPQRPSWRGAQSAASLLAGRSATEGAFASRALRSVVGRWVREVQFDAVFVYCSSMLQYADFTQLADVPLIVDLVDVDSQKWLDYAAGARGVKKLLYSLEARRVRQLESRLPRRAKAIALVSQAEAALYRSVCPNDITIAVTNGVDLEYFSEQHPVARRRPEQCVFVGVLDYRANVESLLWFCREVWPLIVARKPDAQFAIVGKNPGPAVLALGNLPGVRVVGPVPDVRPYLAESRFVVAPLQIARGIQNKVLEAMAMGKAVVATPQAIEGLSATPGVHLLSAAAPSEHRDAMLRLYEDERLIHQLGAAARGYAAAHHSWSACLAPWNSIIGNAAAECGLPVQRRATRQVCTAV